MRMIKFTSTEDKDVLTAILESSSGGVDIGEVRKSIKIIDKLQASQDAVCLEDADYEYLKHRFVSTKFTRVNRKIVEIADAIEFAANVDVTGN